jgi:parallel beta-helix repeat protein
MSVFMSVKHPQKQLRFASRFLTLRFFAGAALIAAICAPAFAATLCVKPKGQAGCYATIGAAVAAASPGDTVKVGPGTYKEDVIIGKSLSLISQSSAAIIDATGLPNGIYVDGRDNPGLNNVVVSGFSVLKANYEGILVTNASDVTIKDNYVAYNDVNLNIEIPTCPGEPDWETGEDFDCGEGVHLSGVSYSTVSNNTVVNNAGGILLSDDTGQTHDNLITGNLAKNNPFDCGIVMASHAPGPGSAAPHLGIINNIISNNTSTQNGYQVPGAGAGVGIFADGSGKGLVHGNIVIGNTLTNNGLPGISFHSHVGPNFFLPADDLNDNVLVGNRISGNGQDLFDTATDGPAGINVSSGGGGTPITGTVIYGNTIDDEFEDVATNTPAKLDVHFNNLLGGQYGVANLGPGAIDATLNYWGCFAGPGGKKCSTPKGPDVTYIPFLPSAFK